MKYDDWGHGLDPSMEKVQCQIKFHAANTLAVEVIKYNRCSTGEIRCVPHLHNGHTYLKQACGRSRRSMAK